MITSLVEAMRFLLCVMLPWLLFGELQANIKASSYGVEDGSKPDASKPQQVSSYTTQVPRHQPDARTRTRSRYQTQVIRYRLDPWTRTWQQIQILRYQPEARPQAHSQPQSQVLHYKAEPRSQALSKVLRYSSQAEPLSQLPASWPELWSPSEPEPEKAFALLASA